MKCRTALRLLLATVSLAAMPVLAAAAATAANVTVSYDHPEHFTETRKVRALAPQRADDDYLKVLKSYIEDRASRILPPGERLDIVVTDIDRAGDFEPWHRGTLREVRINRLVEQTFFAEAIVDGAVESRTVDTRPSDAINLALLTGAPIYVDPAVFAAMAARPDPAHNAALDAAEGPVEIVAELRRTVWAGRNVPSEEEGR